MLTANQEQGALRAVSSQPDAAKVPRNTYDIAESRLAKMLSLEWLGQTIASGCWIASVLSYGITSNGDWLQLLAASAWLIANLAAITKFKAV